jgi:hypothetical protein
MGHFENEAVGIILYMEEEQKDVLVVEFKLFVRK